MQCTNQSMKIGTQVIIQELVNFVFNVDTIQAGVRTTLYMLLLTIK
jgi:hypothetical protein